jgi:hypothetical protein
MGEELPQAVSIFLLDSPSFSRVARRQVGFKQAGGLMVEQPRYPA